jgi:hypothetical protein
MRPNARSTRPVVACSLPYDMLRLDRQFVHPDSYSVINDAADGRRRGDRGQAKGIHRPE